MTKCLCPQQSAKSARSPGYDSIAEFLHLASHPEGLNRKNRTRSAGSKGSACRRIFSEECNRGSFRSTSFRSEVSDDLPNRRIDEVADARRSLAAISASVCNRVGTLDVAALLVRVLVREGQKLLSGEADQKHFLPGDAALRDRLQFAERHGETA